MRTFLEFRELIEQKFPDFRANPSITKSGAVSQTANLNMLTTNPAVSDVLQRRLGQAAAARTMMTRTLPGAVVAGSLAGIDLLKQKRAQDQKNLETRRLSRIASNYGPGGSQKLVQGP